MVAVSSNNSNNYSKIVIFSDVNLEVTFMVIPSLPLFPGFCSTATYTVG